MRRLRSAYDLVNFSRRRHYGLFGGGGGGGDSTSTGSTPSGGGSGWNYKSGYFGGKSTPSSTSTSSVMNNVNSMLNDLMSNQSDSTMAPMAPTPVSQTEPAGTSIAPAPPPAPASVPGTSPWGVTNTAAPSIMGPQTPVYGGQPPPSATSFPTGTMAPSPAPATAPTQPNPYMSAIGAAAPALSNVLAARIAQNRTTQTTGKSPYAVPFQTQQVTVGGSPPPARLSPLERYRMMLSGMR